jgi:hypothetical protein
MSIIPFKVLAVYKPPKWSARRVGRDLCKISAEAGYSPLADSVHGPQLWCPWVSEKLHAEVKRRTPKKRKGADWHQDGDLDPGSQMNHILILWTTNTPTEFRVGNKVYRPKPYEVVAFHNLSGHHRTPPDAKRVRWLFRQRCEIK